MNIQGVKSVYFLGIGGIGMSALARYFRSRGVKVSGYDRTPTALTRELEEEGTRVYYTDDIAHIASDTDLVIYTPAIPSDLAELQYVREKAIRLKKRAEVLGAISLEHLCVAVAGTHGKTSTSSMVAWLLEAAGIPSLAFMGGIAKNFNSNLHLAANPEFMVVEADEFDRSFHQLHPHIAIVTSADADHLDIYGNHRNLLEAFELFVNKTLENGTIILRTGLAFTPAPAKGVKIRTYSVSEPADYMASDIRVQNGQILFTLITPEIQIPDLVLNIPGLVNVENAVAALAAALECGASPELLRAGISQYRGVQRRFDIRFQTEQMTFMDDYAHHPEEIRACIESTRMMWPDQHITGIFQPHLYSRTHDFAKAFAESLDLLDTCLILDIYPAREKPMPGVDSGLILKYMQNPGAMLINKTQVFAEIEKIQDGVLLTIGAGDIDQLVKPICKALTRRYLINS